MTKPGAKLAKKLRKLEKKGKLKRHVVTRIKEFKAKKSSGFRKRNRDIEDDWGFDRGEKHRADNEEFLPLDMLDSDFDLSLSIKVEDVEMEQMRSFEKSNNRLEQLLPIKLPDGSIVSRSRIIEEEPTALICQHSSSSIETEVENDDRCPLSVIELCVQRQRLLSNYKGKIAAVSQQLLATPQTNVNQLNDLLKMAKGEDVESLVRETVQKLATASLVTLFTDLIPGYSIRLPNEQEMAVKLKKETKLLYSFEGAFLTNYLRYLKHLEMCSKAIMKNRKREPVSHLSTTFTYKMAILSVNCLCKLAVRCPHFNFTTNIISFIVTLASTNVPEVWSCCCEAIINLLENDLVGHVSLAVSREISNLVNQKRHAVNPQLVLCLLSLKIKEVDGRKEKTAKQQMSKKKNQVKKDFKSTKQKKYEKQLKKLEQDLRDTEGTERQSNRLTLNTQTMNHVFTTYFRVLRRMPKSALLAPVLKGLSKFAHLINIDFFEDIVASLHDLIETVKLCRLDALRCLHTVFMITSDEGQALNVDPYRFYRCIYTLLPSIAMQTCAHSTSEMELCLQTLDLMLNARRKEVSGHRAAAFIKRLLLLSPPLPGHFIVSVLAAIRTYFLSHWSLVTTFLDEDVPRSGNYAATSDDPDHCNAMSCNIIAELDSFIQHENSNVRRFALHLRHRLPSTGAYRLLSSYTSKKPWEWLYLESDNAIEFPDVMKSAMAVGDDTGFRVGTKRIRNNF